MSTRCSASAPIEAPRSSTIDSPRSVGQSAAIAGRSIPGIVRRLNFAIAISAPVLPAETATSASPFFTASMASHIDDFQRPLRSAWLGLSSIRTATSVWTSRETAFSRGWAASSGSITGWSPNRMNSMSGCRASDSSAPGTTTDGPWSPPMASSAMRTFSGMNDLGDRDKHVPAAAPGRAERDNSGRPRTQQGTPIIAGRPIPRPAGPFFSAASAANGCAADSPADRSSNTAPGLRG